MVERSTLSEKYIINYTRHDNIMTWSSSWAKLGNIIGSVEIYGYTIEEN